MESLLNFFGEDGLAGIPSWWLSLIVCAGVVLGFVALWPLFAVWLERKASADFQQRLGPMYVGGWHGWLQTLADGIKLAFKEDLLPRASDKFLFWIAPAVAFLGAFTCLVVIPLAPGWQVVDLDLGIFFLLCISSIGTIGVVMAGWSSNNKWSLYGAMREAAQLVSYEVPMAMALLVPVMVVGSLKLGDIVAYQTEHKYWLLMHSPWMLGSFLIFYIASLAECKRAPFDLPEAESELVSGFHTEYSGLRFSFFFLEEYVFMFVASIVAALVYLGGWQPLPGVVTFEFTSLIGKLFGAGVVVGKAVFLVWVQIWLRWTLPRLRIDQVMVMGYKYLVPCALLVLIGQAFFVYWNTHWLLF